MKNFWMVSDTHINHANILNFTRRDGSPLRVFDDVNHMNETIIQNWNSVVKPGDRVWHLGDVYFGKDFEKVDSILSRLNGKKALILGNHDDPKCPVLQKHFEKIVMWRIFKDMQTVLTHTPIYLGNDDIRKYNFNVHGHIHAGQINDPRYLNISVEETNYFPVNIEETIRKTFKVSGNVS